MKDALVIGGICLLAVIAGALFYFKGSDILALKQEGALEHAVIAQGTNAVAIDMRTNYRIEDQDQLVALWSLVYGNNAPNMPGVDFETNEVIAVFDGTHSTGGYRVHVTSVTDTGLNRVVGIEHVEPHADCPVAAVQTSPFELVVVPKMSDALTLTREETTTISPCS